MGGSVGPHAADDGQVIDTLADAREQLGNRDACLAVLRKLPGRAEQLPRPPLAPGSLVCGELSHAVGLARVSGRRYRPG